MTTAGEPLDPRQQLRQQRIQNRLVLEQLRGQRLDRLQKRAERRQALEATLLYDWVTPYMDLVDRLRRGEPETVGPTSAWQRKWGRNYPIFQSEQELALLRAPARVLEATNTYAQGAISALNSYVIGGGYNYRATLNAAAERDEVPTELADACQEIVDDFIARNGWQVGDDDGYSDDYYCAGLEDEFFKRTLVDGEGILCHFCDDKTGHVTVRTVEPEQLTMPPNEQPAECMWGIRTPPDDAQHPLGYFITWTGNPSDCEEIKPEYITHFKRNVVRSIKRGLTDFSFDALDAFNLAGRLRVNMTDTAAQQAAIVGVMQHDSGTKDDIQAMRTDDAEWQETDALTQTSQNVRRNRRGEWQDVPKGQQYVAGPLATNSPIHIQVLQACLRGAGVKWNAPEWMVSGDASNNNFASALVANSPFVNYARGQQRGYKACYRRSMWIQLRHWCKVHGAIVAKGRQWSWDEVKKYVGITVGAPSPEARDELQDAQRAAIEIPLGVDSRQRYAQDQGRDWARIERDNQQFEDEHGSQGEPLPLPGEETNSPGFESAIESWLRECGGKGGDPGPCKKGGGAGDSAELDGLRAQLGDAAKEPGTWEKVKAVHGKVKAAALAGVNTVLAKAHEWAPEILDTADDWMKLTMAKGHDALALSTGIPAQTAGVIVSHVLARAVVAIKAKLGRESEAQPDFELLAGLVIELLKGLHEALGVEFTPPDAGEVEGAIKAKVQARKI